MSRFHSRLGKEGENTACAHLVDKGFHIYRMKCIKKWSELDPRFLNFI